MTSNNNNQVTHEDDEACMYAMELVHSSTLLMVMNAAIELDILELINKNGKISASNIISKLPTQNPNSTFLLERMLHLLASYSILTCTLSTIEDGKIEKLYSIAPAGKFFVRDVNGGSFAKLFTMQFDRAIMEMMYHWKDAFLKGDCVWNETHKMTIGKYMEKQPTLAKHFNTAMSDMIGVTMKKILETYKGFEGLKTLVDIGGGNGTTLNMIISKYPSIKGINFDLPHVIKNAPSFQGIEHVGGNMFESFPKGDAILFKHVIHNWNDESCRKLLTKCYQVLPQNGRVIIMESILPAVPETHTAAKYVSLVDNVMVATIDGKERTKDEFIALCNAAGFSKFQFISCHCNFWAIEAYK